VRIALFTTEFPYVRADTGEITYMDGGVGNATLQLARHLERRGHEIIVFTSANDAFGSVERRGGIEVRRYPRTGTVGQTPVAASLLYRPLISGVDADLAHAHMGNLPAPLTACWYAKTKKIPLVTTYHNDWMNGFGSLSRRAGVFLFNHYFCDRILSRSDRIIALSENHARSSKFLRKYRDAVTIIPNGVDVPELNTSLSKEVCRETLGLPPGAPIILFVGNLTPMKAPEVLLNALARVAVEMPDVCAVFVGDGALRPSLIERSEALGLRERALFPGAVYDERKSMYYRAADVFVLPSVSESFGLVLLEASASGLPLVVSDLEPLRALVREGYNGVFAPPGDAKELADRILSLLQDDRLRERMGENAKRHLEQHQKAFSWERIAELTEDVYRAVL